MHTADFILGSMVNANADRHGAVQSDVFYRLTVIVGYQQDSEIQIPCGSVMYAGTALDNDIVLYSPTARSCRLQIDASINEVKITVLEGELERGDELMLQKHSFSVVDSDVLAVDGLRFVITRDDTQRFDGGASAEKTHDRNGHASLNQPLNKWTNLPLILLSLGLGLVLIIFAYTISTGLVRAFNDDTENAFKKILSEEGFGHLAYVEPSEQTNGRLSGIVETSQEKNRLLELSGAREESIDVDLQVNETFTAPIVDLYRVNGIKADVVATGFGEITVWTSTSNLEALESIEANVKTDFPSVVALTANNVLPAEKLIVAEDVRVAIRDPDKQVTLVVAGPKGYLMTKDKSRYFVGSMLPSGHVIEKIEAGDVFVSLDGKHVKLEF